MNKAELIAAVAEHSGLTKTDSERAINGVLGTIQNTLRNGGEVSITNFGRFTVADRKERAGRNLATGEALVIPATKVPVFKAGKEFKSVVAS